MRSLLAVCLSAIMMMGAADAATIDGDFNVDAGVSETYTFTVPLLPGEEFYSATLSVNGSPWSKPASSTTQTGSVSLKFLQTFEVLGKQSLSVSAYINYVAFGSYECVGVTAGCNVPNYLQNPTQKRVSEFFVTQTVSVFVALPEQAAIAASEFVADRAAVVPIAGTLPLLLSGLGILGWAARRRARVLA